MVREYLLEPGNVYGSQPGGGNKNAENSKGEESSEMLPTNGIVLPALPETRWQKDIIC